MSVKDDFMGASILAKIALIVLLIASLFICIAFTTTGWVSNTTAAGQHWGMWRSCGNADLSSSPCAPLDGWANSWYAGTQAMVTIGFFGILVATALVIFYFFLDKCQKNGEVALAAGIIAIVTGVFLLIGVIVFGAEVNDWMNRNPNDGYKLDYDFGLAIVAMLLEIVGGVLMIIEKVKGGGGGGGGVQASA